MRLNGASMIIDGRHAVHLVCLADSLKKPVLYPLWLRTGSTVTRGYPLDAAGRGTRGSSAPCGDVVQLWQCEWVRLLE